MRSPAHAGTTCGTSLPRSASHSESISRVGVPTPRSFPFEKRRFSSLIATSGVYFQTLTRLDGISQVRRASCRGTFPKEGTPYFLALPHINRFTGDVSKVAFGDASFNLAVQVRLWARSRIQAKRCAPVWCPWLPCALSLQPTDCSRA
jgi:hypothetical protein